MARVHVLPPEIVSKIAAGEVIDRPASVIKELVENSLDAGAHSIDITLKQSGITQINVRDNGSGIDAEDIETIFGRHSTSKLSSIDDLDKIQSLGFRGEALYSIAAVSDITLRSKTAKAETGWEIHMRGGSKLSLKPVSMNTGSDIEIRELFFNTPARRKFLKSGGSELAQVVSTLTPYLLAHPESRFTLTHEKRALFNLNAHAQRVERAAATLHLNAQHILTNNRNFPKDEVFIELLLGDINIQRPRKDLQFIFINNRPVQSRELNFHMNSIYRLIFPPKVYPFFCLFIKMPASDIDVNVHPTKREVKIRDEKRIISLLRPFCEHTLMTQGKAKQARLTTIETAPKSVSTGQEQEFKPLLNIHEVREPQKQYTLIESENAFEFKSGSMNKGDLKNTLERARFIGSFIKKYLLFEAAHSLLLIDQHAAQERITYEKLKLQIETGTLQTQHLLSPILIRLTTEEFIRWEKIKQKLETLGMSTTRWDNENIALHSHPILIKNSSTAVLNLLSENPESLVDNDSLARRACKQSITAGYDMNKEQSEYLRQQLIKCSDPFTCPHGRPTVIEMDEGIFNKQFLR